MCVSWKSATGRGNKCKSPVSVRAKTDDTISSDILRRVEKRDQLQRCGQVVGK